MALSDELTRLDELHQRGALNDDEFARAKGRALGGSTPEAPAPAAINALRLSNGDRWIAGVCGGIAHATGVTAWVWRLLFVVFTICGGAGLLLYVLLWIFVPREQPGMA